MSLSLQGKQLTVFIAKDKIPDFKQKFWILENLHLPFWAWQPPHICLWGRKQPQFSDETDVGFSECAFLMVYNEMSTLFMIM